MSNVPGHNTQKPVRRIGFDLSILDRVETGTSVYAKGLFDALRNLDQTSFEFIALRAPKPFPRKNFLTKLGNFAKEVIWLTLLLPIHAKKAAVELVHMPANTISPFLRIPQLCSIHDAHFITNPENRELLWTTYARLTFRYAARHADHILCFTNSAKKDVVDILGAMPEKVDVVYHGLPHRESMPEDRAEVARYQPYILSVGVSAPNKNLPSLVEAFAAIANKPVASGLNLVIAGPPGRDHPRLIKIAAEKKIADRVHILGKVSDSLLAALYENAHIFAFPSFCEGFGFPPLEAMHFGIPVAASNAPCIPETLGGAALYFDPRKPSEIASRIENLLTDPELRYQLKHLGKSRAKDFTWEKTAANTLAIYASMLKDG